MYMVGNYTDETITGVQLVCFFIDGTFRLPRTNMQTCLMFHSVVIPCQWQLLCHLQAYQFIVQSLIWQNCHCNVLIVSKGFLPISHLQPTKISSLNTVLLSYMWWQNDHDDATGGGRQRNCEINKSLQHGGSVLTVACAFITGICH
jgi:hypothetical protein